MKDNKMEITNHYKWLDENFLKFLKKLNIKNPEYYIGMIVAHGDKCYSYRYQWEEKGIPFEKGVAIYLVSYISPFSKTVRETQHGWVNPCDWVIYQWEMGWSKFF